MEGKDVHCEKSPPPPFDDNLPVLTDGKHIMTNTSHAPNTCVLDFLHVHYMQQDTLY